MHNDVFKLYAEIIELTDKPNIPMGDLGHNLVGEKLEFESDSQESSCRAIIALGLLDIESNHLRPVDKSVELVGESSDMIVVDLGVNPNDYKVGDLLEFDMTYMGILRVMNSVYVEKRLVSKEDPITKENLKPLSQAKTKTKQIQ